MGASRPGRYAVSAGIALAGLVALTIAHVGRAADQETRKAEPAAKGKAQGGLAVDYIDSMLKEAWDEAKIKPSHPATDAEFLRRVYLDTIGRIPTVQEAEAFLASKEPGKRAKLVNYLLDSPDFAKNFGNIWTLLLIGRQRQERQVDRGALANWLRVRFAENRPWDQVAYDLITATGSNKENGACNFTLAHLENGAVPLTSFTTRLFLGQQIQCTQCHDHPYNDWKQKDFWGINAFFKGIHREDVEKADATGAEVYDHTELSDTPSDAYSTYEKRNAYIEIAFPTFLDGRKVGQGRDVERRKELGKFVTGPDNDQFARAFVNRMWGHYFGRGFVQPVDDFGAHNPPSHPELLDQLAGDFKANGYNVKDLIRWICNSKAYQLSSEMTKANEKDESLFSHMALKPLTPEQMFDSLLVATQAHKTAGAEMDRKRAEWLNQFVVAFANDEQGETSGFQGTIPQALMMMNGELMQKATGGKPGSFLARVLDESRSKGRGNPAPWIVRRLYLAALSRAPSNAELANAGRFLGSNPDSINVIEDLFWALLNSNEFILNR